MLALLIGEQDGDECSVDKEMNVRSTIAAFVATLLPIGALAANGTPTPSPERASAYILAPKGGEIVSSPVLIVFGLRGMGVAPAGVEHVGTGHHHLIVDADLPSLVEPIPEDKHYLHFGGGQTETSLRLPPGTHTLQLLLGDQNHIPHTPVVLSSRITITVK